MIQRLIDLRSRICRWIVGWNGGWYPAYWEYAVPFLWGSVLLVGEIHGGDWDVLLEFGYQDPEF